MRKLIFAIFIVCFTIYVSSGFSASDKSKQKTNTSNSKTSAQLKQRNISVCSKNPPSIVIEIEKPQTKYVTNLSPKEFAKKHNISECSTLDGELFCMQGLTVPPPMFVSLKLATQSIPRRNKVYACPQKLTLTIKFEAPIWVYVTNQVKKNSCRYNVVYNHENYHVAVFKQSIDFFKPQIKQFFQNELKKLLPYEISKPNEFVLASEQFSSTLMTNFKPVQEYINKKINEKNNAIDTPESYKIQSALCDGKE